MVQAISVLAHLTEGSLCSSILASWPKWHTCVSV